MRWVGCWLWNRDETSTDLTVTYETWICEFKQVVVQQEVQWSVCALTGKRCGV